MSRLILFASWSRRCRNLSIFDPSSPAAHAIRSLFILVLAVCGVILVVVRRCAHLQHHSIPPPQRGNSRAAPGVRQHADRDRLDGAPALTVFVLALILTRTEFLVRVDPKLPPAGSKPLYVTVIGHQWWWEYVYEKYDDQKLGFITANELHVPASDDRRSCGPFT